MNKTPILLLFLLFVFTGFKTNKPAYMLYNNEGKTVKFSKLLKEISKADIILFGENHSNPISHWLQLEVTKSLFGNFKGSLVLGAEMFETDNQVILDEYLAGLISQNYFESEARIWPNYKTDYKPLVEFAKNHKLNFIATNIPRRYASVVNAKGFEGLEELSDEAKAFLPPLPVPYNPDLESYKSLLEMKGMSNHMGENFPKAQAVKDATMAHFILQNWTPRRVFLHFNGSYHSDNYESINWYLKKYNPDVRIATITTVSQKDISKLEDEHEGKADFIICVDEDMTQTR